ncbi:MAG: class I SAM-dependent DNA methyltransferase [bacterium]|nr:class I SAM-dependent DNA methyltransferase [bacterium]
MRLSWNEVRVRAAAFAERWRDAAYEKGETQSFYNDFFAVFGVDRRSVARFEQHVTKLDDKSGYIDLFWPGVLLVEQKSAGLNLGGAYEQAGQYFDALPMHEQPRFIMVSDFQNFELRDLDERETVAFPLAALPDNVEAFGFVMGVRQRTFRDQDPANIKAAELVGRLHDKLEETGYRGHDLERFLVRIVFCLFADDTGIFDPRDIFFDFIEERTSVDGADLGPWLSQLFQVLDTPVENRSERLDADLARFPYVNGDLFEGPLRIPSFDGAMRDALLDACRFDWSEISPAIFGALFQSVMDPKERRSQGAHYTTEKNILKVISPLFLDGLREEFDRLKARQDSRRLAELRQFRRKLGELRFLDPACGCGNFLIISYRELRLLEIEVMREISADTEREGQRALSAELASAVNVDQFYGIELSEFPARIAEAAMWMMDHIMNNRLSLELGEVFARIPLQTSPKILCADALEVDWTEVLPPGDCSFVLGNPPFIGSKLQTPEQRAQLARITASAGSTGTLDYVTAWFIKAGGYSRAGGARIGFVATNSISQGEQPAQLWPILFTGHGLEIAYAHCTFAWGSDARGKAHVHVIIIGLDRREDAPVKKRLFSYPDPNGDPEETLHSAISPYLTSADGLTDPHLTIQKQTNPANGMRKLVIGSKPIDKGHYIFNTDERNAFLAAEPAAERFMRPFVGAKEFVSGIDRWILSLHDAPPELLARLPLTRERMAAVKEFRSNSSDAGTRKLADTPTLFHINVIPKAPFLVVPKSTSERREYVPIGWLEPPTIPSDAVFALEGATLADFALLTSAMHMAWLRQTSGRLKSDYRYSIGIVYNTFPTPPGYTTASPQDFPNLEAAAQAVLDARGNHPGATLENLYDPDLMPPDLRRAHQRLDRETDRLYKRSGFSSERDRVEHLLALYEQSQARLITTGPKPARRRRAVKRPAL